MSDLISREALLIFASNHKDKTVDMNDIARFPTAYDMDKVVERLEELPHRRLQLSDAMMDIMESKKTDRHFVCLEDVTEIVKGGGQG